nr:SlyX family protein [Donghicola mangrovi]
MENRIDLIEERLAHLLKSVDDLSDVVARQEKEISVLTRRVQMLMEREAAREASAGVAEIVGDERPPHY